MIRQAEQDIQALGNDVKHLIYNDLEKLQTRASQAANELSNDKDPTLETLQSQLGPFTADNPINLVVLLANDGSFKAGCFLTPGEALQPVESTSIQPYLDATVPQLSSASGQGPVSGLIVFQDRPLFFALAPVTGSSGGLLGYIGLGSLFRNAPMLNRLNSVTHGMQVSMNDALHGQAPCGGTPSKKRMAPGFQDAVNFYSGGRWHLGENAFEAVLPITDLLGKEVSSISIRLPGSFSSLASIALGWLTSFIACVGILFVMPIFWFQTRIVLNPLTVLSRKIQEIGEKHLDGDCPAINWPHRDEFGVLARSVNEMVLALASKTRQNNQNEMRQKALIAGMPDCLCVVDPQANIVLIHKQPDYAHPIPGLVPGRPISPPLFPDSDCAEMQKTVEEAFAAERIQMVMISCRDTDGSYRHFEVRVSRMDAFFALVIMRDVTKEWRERETREQVEDRLAKVEKMESLGTLAAGIAHDFNNILAIIQNTIEGTWESLSAPERGAISTIRQATTKGATLTRELMTYAGHTRVNFKRQDPNTLVMDLERLMGGVIASNVILELKLTPGLSRVDADPHQFWKIIINLLKNASEAMNGSSGNIRISTYPFDLTPQNVSDFFSTHALTLGPGVVFQIDDTGSGIPKQVISRMFEPFFSTKAMGRGLGLATVFGIVDAHNGGIAIASEPGKGTSFRVWLPAAKATPPGEQPPADPPAAHEREFQSALASEKTPRPAVTTGPLPLVLLVEDDRSILQATALLLRSLKVESLTASTKREALALFRKNADAIKLILLDAQIGQFDNVRLLNTFRMRKPGVPTVILSGHTEAKIKQMFASEPYEGFLSKPYTRNELKAILEQFASIS